MREDAANAQNRTGRGRRIQQTGMQKRTAYTAIPCLLQRSDRCSAFLTPDDYAVASAVFSAATRQPRHDIVIPPPRHHAL